MQKEGVRKAGECKYQHTEEEGFTAWGSSISGVNAQALPFSAAGLQAYHINIFTENWLHIKIRRNKTGKSENAPIVHTN